MKLQKSYLTGFIFAFSLGLSACEKDGPMEQAGEDVDGMVDNAKDEAEDVRNRIEDACEDVKDEMNTKNRNC